MPDSEAIQTDDVRMAQVYLYRCMYVWAYSRICVLCAWPSQHVCVCTGFLLDSCVLDDIPTLIIKILSAPSLPRAPCSPRQHLRASAASCVWPLLTLSFPLPLHSRLQFLNNSSRCRIPHPSLKTWLSVGIWLFYLFIVCLKDHSLCLSVYPFTLYFPYV